MKEFHECGKIRWKVYQNEYRGRKSTVLHLIDDNYKIETDEDGYEAVETLRLTITAWPTEDGRISGAQFYFGKPDHDGASFRRTFGNPIGSGIDKVAFEAVVDVFLGTVDYNLDFEVEENFISEISI